MASKKGWKLPPDDDVDVKYKRNLSKNLIMSWRIGRQLSFLRSILKAADHQTRRERLQLANADQINALSELIMNTLCEQISVLSSTLAKLRPHEQALREMTRHKHSFKKRRQIMMSQKGRGLLQGLNTAYNHCLRDRRVSSP